MTLVILTCYKSRQHHRIAERVEIEIETETEIIKLMIQSEQFPYVCCLITFSHVHATTDEIVR